MESGFSTFCGTQGFRAPEICGGKYNKPCDFWSLGMVLYVVLTFNVLAIDRHVTANLIKSFKEFNNDRKINSKKPITNGCIDLVRQLLKTDPLDRITGEDMIKHPWFENMNHKNETIKNDDDTKELQLPKLDTKNNNDRSIVMNDNGNDNDNNNNDNNNNNIDCVSNTNKKIIQTHEKCLQNINITTIKNNPKLQLIKEQQPSQNMNVLNVNLNKANRKKRNLDKMSINDNINTNDNANINYNGNNNAKLKENKENNYTMYDKNNQIAMSIVHENGSIMVNNTNTQNNSENEQTNKENICDCDYYMPARKKRKIAVA